MTYEDNSGDIKLPPARSKFEETVKQDTPRLVVKMRNTPSGEQFEWGIVGNLPPLSLMGALRRVINEIPNITVDMLQYADQVCPEVAVVLVYDADIKDFDWFAHPDCLCYPMIGMLEMIISMLTDANKVRQAAAQSMVVGLDGKPYRG